MLALVGACLTLSACGGGGGGGGDRGAIRTVTVPTAGTPKAAQQLGIPVIATKNTTRIAGGDPIADAAGVAQAVYPAAAAGTHPTAVTVAPTDDWQGALASAVLMSAPIKAPVLLSGKSSLPVGDLRRADHARAHRRRRDRRRAGDPGRRRPADQGRQDRRDPGQRSVQARRRDRPLRQRRRRASPPATW